jgi:glutamate racemase
MASDAPVGIFDSGMGGLSVLREIERTLPSERLLFVADSAHAPYGDRAPEYVQRRAHVISEFFLQHEAKAIVVASNTTTAAAAELLRATFALPVVAVEPAVKPAAAATKSGVIGVLATSGTLASRRFATLRERVADGVEVVIQPCPGLVEQVEAGDLSGPTTRRLVDRFVGPLVAAGADTIVLGSTHYPLLSGLIRDEAGPGVTLVETGPAVARQLGRILRERGLANDAATPAELARFWTSGDPERVHAVAGKILGRPVRFQHLGS